METFVASVLLTFLAITAIGIIVLKDLLAGVILLGVYSLIAAGAFVVMDAVDVAFTEAAVGSGISTILFLGALSFTKHQQKKPSDDSLMALVFVVVTGGVLIYGTLDMPHYGDANSAAQTHPELAVRFIEVSGDEVGPPNIVTSVLASYRGYDTLGETLVVFAAGIAVLSLLGLKRRRPEDDVPEDAPGDVPGAGLPGAGLPGAGLPADATGDTHKNY
jgi:multicomponent Na+:H+ antiporter subunit B